MIAVLLLTRPNVTELSTLIVIVTTVVTARPLLGFLHRKVSNPNTFSSYFFYLLLARPSRQTIRRTTIGSTSTALGSATTVVFFLGGRTFSFFGGCLPGKFSSVSS